MRKPIVIFVLAALAVGLNACASQARLPVEAGFGAHPELPAPRRSLIPTLKVAPARSWRLGEKPIPAAGFEVQAYATGLNHPRWLYVLPNGDVLVAETNAPRREQDGKGLKGWIMGLAMKRAGAGVPSANRITLLRDRDGDGVAETQTAFLQGLNSPFGMALVGDDLYVANTDAIVRFAYTQGVTQISTPGTRVAKLPAGPIDHHWTKNVIANSDGSLLYASVGSNSNAGENGVNNEEGRAVILEIDPASGSSRVFASGLRNPNGLAWQPQSGALWAAVNERDELGSDLVPDYMTAVTEGGFYGWPYSYYGQHVDARVQPPRADLVAKALVPDYALGAHTASLGLAFYRGDLFPERYVGGAFIGQHGSWNRNPRSGYQVIFVPFANGRPAGPPEDILGGFLDSRGRARGRPVGVAIDRAGAVLVADDVGNTVWRITPVAAARH